MQSRIRKYQPIAGENLLRHRKILPSPHFEPSSPFSHPPPLKKKLPSPLSGIFENRHPSLSEGGVPTVPGVKSVAGGLLTVGQQKGVDLPPLR